MRRTILWASVLTGVLVTPATALLELDVTPFPAQPFTNTGITVQTSATLSMTGFRWIDTTHTVDGNQVDIVHLIRPPDFGIWTTVHSYQNEPIGLLPEGSYDVNVEMWAYRSLVPNSTYLYGIGGTSFHVMSDTDPQTEWLGPPAQTGDWHNLDNWSGHVPSPSVDAAICNGGAAQLTGDALTKNLHIYGPGGGLDLNGHPLYASDPLAKVELNHAVRLAHQAPGTGIFDSTITDPDAVALGVGDAGSGFTMVRQTVPGDATLDRTVDMADFQQFVAGWQESQYPDWEFGDFNYDGVTDLFDFQILVGHWGETFAATGHPVPEPTAGAIVALGALAMLRRRRRGPAGR